MAGQQIIRKRKDGVLSEGTLIERKSASNNLRSEHL